MARLRLFAVMANIAFVAYGASVPLWPVVALHSVLLPINVLRLVRQPPRFGPSPMKETDR
jgi:CRP/FNR family transcriptional regulator, cyclic AMP receptor protein